MHLYVDRELTARTAPAFCDAAADALACGEPVVVTAVSVKGVDAVGLAVLLQAARQAAEAALPWTVTPSPALEQALLDAGVADEIAVGEREAIGEVGAVRVVPPFPTPDGGDVLIAEPRVVLRVPTWADFACFDRWAAEPQLEARLSSTLLYRCRHLGAYHPDVVALLSAQATALTALVVPRGEAPVGFVRLHDVNLTEGSAFLEAAIACRRGVQRGWGVIAARLLLSYAMDVLDVRRVETKVQADDVRSINALRRNGFTLEGRLRATRDDDRRRRDMLVFGMLRDEMAIARARHGIPHAGLWPSHVGSA